MSPRSAESPLLTCIKSGLRIRIRGSLSEGLSHPLRAPSPADRGARDPLDALAVWCVLPIATAALLRGAAPSRVLDGGGLDLHPRAARQRRDLHRRSRWRRA